MLLSIGRRIGDDHIDGRLSERPSENAEKDYMIILETGQLSFTVLHGICARVFLRASSLSGIRVTLYSCALLKIVADAAALIHPLSRC